MAQFFGPALANIFFGYHEYKTVAFQFENFTPQKICWWHILDFYNWSLNVINFLLSLIACREIVEKEKDGAITFLDVKFENNRNEFLTSIYKKKLHLLDYTQTENPLNQQNGKPIYRHFGSSCIKNLLKEQTAIRFQPN